MLPAPDSQLLPFDENGDTTEGSVTIYRVVRGKPIVFAVVAPPASLVHDEPRHH